MNQKNDTAEYQLLKLIDNLLKSGKSLNNTEYYSVEEAITSICENKQLRLNLKQSLKAINYREIQIDGNLTKREKQVFLLIGEDIKNSDIAIKLNISTSTIETHRKNIRKKLKLRSNENLFVVALLFVLQN